MFNFFYAIFSLIYSIEFLLCILLFLSLLILFLYTIKRKLHRKREKNPSKLTVAIFHPYCNAGGGGEKVLWVALQALHYHYPNAEYYIYTGDMESTPQEILTKTSKTLNVKIEQPVKFIYLTRRKWVEAHKYPFFTLLGQALGSMYLGLEAIFALNPNIYIETTGFTFTLPIFKYLGGCKTGCYVHYPIITTDMIKRVSSRQSIYNNRSFIARNPIVTDIKLLYYRIFMWTYSLAGNCSDINMVNSTFTLEHLNKIWNRPLHLVYPPCEIDHLKKIPRPLKRPEKIRILSLSQFRPEKDHVLQLQSLYELREIIPEHIFENITLVMFGSCRNSDDSNRVADLRDLSKHFSLENNVEFKVNCTYEELLDEMERSYIGIHTMLDEHFGIAIVELMAAGLIVVAHRSGGPLLDIIETSEGSRLGFLAVTAEEYATTIKHILMNCSDDDIMDIREKARASVERFNTKKFQEEFLRAIAPLFKQ